MPQPVNPATSRLEMSPRLRGNRLDTCSWLRWNVIPARPSSTAPAGRPLTSRVLLQPSSASASMLSSVPGVRARGRR